MRCHKCKRELDITERPGRGEHCPQCYSDLKVCLNCAFYDAASYNECREPQAERVTEKDRANFCDYFRAAKSEATPGGDGTEEKSPSLDDLKDLFK